MNQQDSNDLECRLDNITEDFVARLRQGECPTLAEYVQRFPDLAAEIEELFPTLATLERTRDQFARADNIEFLHDISRTRDQRLERLGDYDIIREAGRGGMGIVYEAEQRSLGRRVALKVLPVHALLEPRHVQRFQQEARAVARLHHTNIVPVFGVGEQDGLHYYVMQYIDGKGLDRVLHDLSETAASRASVQSPTKSNASTIAKRCLPGLPQDYWRNVAEIGIQASEALAYASEQGVLHRDIKPSNLLLDSQGTIWVTDFGLAKAIDNAELTNSGDIVGTLRYLAPERFRSQFDHRSDIYSLGLTLYELATLCPAFRDCDRPRMIEQILNVEPPAPRQVESNVPRDLETIVLKAIAKEPTRRYQSASELADDLRRFVADRPIRARRSSPAERLWRWCRRNPIPALLSTALALAVILGAGGITWKWREAVDARERESAARGDANQSADALRRSLENLKLAHLHLEWGRSHAEKSHWDTANTMLTKAIQLQPNHVSAWHERSNMYAQMSLWDYALDDFKQILRLQEPDTTMDWYRSSLLLIWQNDEEGFRDVSGRMRRRFQGTNDIFFSSELIRTQCLFPLPAVDFGSIVPLAREIVRDYDQSWNNLYLLGLTEYRAGNFLEAIAALEKSLDAMPVWTGRSLSCPVLAMAYYRVGRVEDARKTLERAARALDEWVAYKVDDTENVNWPNNWNAIPRSLVAWWDLVECQHFFREAMLLVLGETPRNDARHDLLRARSLACLRFHKEANQAFERAVANAPGDKRIQVEFHRHRGYEFGRSNQWHDAVVEFQKVTELLPTDFYSWRFLAHCQLAIDDKESYRKSCQSAMQAASRTNDPRSAMLLIQFATVCDDSIPDPRELLPAAELAHRLFQIGATRMASTLYRVGRYEDAIELLENRSQRFRPGYECFLFLAMAHEKLGHHTEAKRQLEKGRQWIADATRNVGEFTDDAHSQWGAWDDPIACEVLLRETEQIVEGDDRRTR